tara:strand:+ start:1083 stop:2309 length:1227 start_codon:yes stop_codon:yes gene_type:complete
MGFNFGAFLGGAADQIVKDLDEQEKEVKLRTRTILDRQIAETAANRKEYKANKKKVTEQLNALIPLFGDDKNAIAKARSIVAGGDTHFTNMLNMLQNHKLNGGDANTIVKFAPDAEVTGFKNVEDATSSLVQMANIPAPTFGKKDETASMFGVGMGNYYEKARKQYVAAGLLDPTRTGEDSAVAYTSAIVDLSGLKQDTKTLQVQKAEVVSKMRDYLKGGGTVNDKEYKALVQERDFLDTNILSGNAAIKVAEVQNKNDGVLTVANHQKILQSGLAKIESKYKENSTIASVGPENVSNAKEKEITKFKTDYVKGLIANGMDNNAFNLIKADPSLSKIYNKITEDALKVKDKNDAFSVEVGKAKQLGTPQAYIDSLPSNQKIAAALKPLLEEAFPNADIENILETNQIK